jgi:hypothetical protein
MAKYLAGPAVGVISGKEGGVVFSHNRYGPYFRTKGLPVNPNTSYQQVIRGFLVQLTQAWAALGTNGQEAWRTYAADNPMTDRLGQKHVLSGHVAYIGLNSRILQAGGTVILVPPVVASPPSLLTIALSVDIGAGNFQVAFTATPLAAGNCLYVDAAVVESPGVKYIKNKLRLVSVSAAALASPLDIQAACEARFGTLIVGQRVVVIVSVLSKVTGLMSGSLRADGTIVST